VLIKVYIVVGEKMKHSVGEGLRAFFGEEQTIYPKPLKGLSLVTQAAVSEL